MCSLTTTIASADTSHRVEPAPIPRSGSEPRLRQHRRWESRCRCAYVRVGACATGPMAEIPHELTELSSRCAIALPS
jgi:hypothetical protein